MFCRLCALEKPHTIPIINENILDIDESDLNIDMKLKDLLSLEVNMFFTQTICFILLILICFIFIFSFLF